MLIARILLEIMILLRVSFYTGTETASLHTSCMKPTGTTKLLQPPWSTLITFETPYDRQRSTRRPGAGWYCSVYSHVVRTSGFWKGCSPLLQLDREPEIAAGEARAQGEAQASPDQPIISIAPSVFFNFRVWVIFLKTQQQQKSPLRGEKRP